MQLRDRARLLLRKARDDEFAVLKLSPDPQSPDPIIGFHAQQAVEKGLKAVLALNNVVYPRTHDLVLLIDLLKDAGVALPEALDDVRRLNPFAVTVRYGDLSDESEEPFDRAWAIESVRGCWPGPRKRCCEGW